LKILLIDNYDSFVYNLYQLLGTLGADVDVVRNNRLEPALVSRYDGVVISPGPGDPRDAKRTGVGHDVIQKYAEEKPILGVCLGHQEIVHVYGGTIRYATILKHGKTSLVEHGPSLLFEGIPARFLAARYHSLVADGAVLPGSLVVTARALDDREVMAVEHRKHPVFGVQFHPESVLTKAGPAIVQNFLEVCRR